MPRGSKTPSACCGVFDYSADQIEKAHRIEALKCGGLSLKEIREILRNADDSERVKGILESRESEYKNMLAAIAEVKRKMSEKEEKVTKAGRENEAVVEKNELGEYAVKEDFYSEVGERRESYYGNNEREIYFLPGGEDYWVYSWTKGYLKLNSGPESCLCRYQIEDYQGSRYMFVENKSYEYLRGGMPTVLVLEQVDRKRYTRREIAREDDTSLPFVNDERVLGDWKAFDFIRNKEEFSVEVKHLPQCLPE